MSKDDNKHNGFQENLIQRGKDASKVRKIVAIIIVCFTLIIIIGGISAYLYIKSALQPIDEESSTPIEVEIPIGSSSSTIAGILEENGIIKDARVFRFYTKFNNVNEFQAGNYTFNTAMSLDEIIDSLQNGRIIVDAVHTITIPEGLTVDQIAEIYSERLDFSKEDFLEVANDPDFIEELMEEYPSLLTEDILDDDIRTPLEGYMFASTYDFYEEQPDIESIIDRMVEQTNTIFQQYEGEIAEQDLTPHEAITFASVVEKETAHEEERPQIAGVFYNRLNEDMPLQTDPTVLYAKGEHQAVVTFEDLEVESPYNTYVVNGLPVGPISNFAENSLIAVLSPEDSDYLFFLHDEEGNIHFAETFDDHIENREEYIN
ncbi:endolytic transglycosylase MltG [Oceanobacillus sp. CFH 90083]|uniref:endolytic transglycosylase MltG n=1 Tax=Oceanobacillus sp. CFH 90083 TaxID=2592336 RepID=UPI001D13D808|nr:endolytic transglycosylase MltG [Oceanobacillus sp. CFH 90083]